MIPFLTSGSGSCQLTAIEVDVGDNGVMFSGGPLGTAQIGYYSLIEYNIYIIYTYHPPVSVLRTPLG